MSLTRKGGVKQAESFIEQLKETCIKEVKRKSEVTENRILFSRRFTLTQILFGKSYCVSKKKRTFEKEELYGSIGKGRIASTKQNILKRAILINMEESYQTGFEKERRINNFIEVDGFCSKLSLINKDGLCFCKKKRILAKIKTTMTIPVQSLKMSINLSATSDLLHFKTSQVNRMKHIV